MMPLINLPPTLIQICEAIKQASGRAYLAGGMVRDSLLAHPSKDIDLEVHKISEQTLLDILNQFGHPNAVGKSFHVWILNIGEYHVDISLTDVPNIKEACRRRDLRINALLYDPLTDEILDPFGGLDDIKHKILVATDPIFFADDPLRVLRVAQFAARFDFQICPSLRALCLGLDLSSLSPERVLKELEKAWLKSPKPSLAFTEFLNLKVISKYFGAWRGLEESEVLQSLDRGKSYCTDQDGWNMALFWGIALQKCFPKEAEHILDQLNVHRFLNYPIRQAVFASLQFSEKLAKTDNSVLRNHAAEVFSLDFLCTISMSIWEDGLGFQNLQKAKIKGIESSALPRFIQGRDILPFGLKGRDIGRCLSFIRGLELNEEIQDKAQGLKAVEQWLQMEKERL